MSLKRTYNIGNGWTVEDDGHVLYFIHRDADQKWTRSFGCPRPKPRKEPEPGDTVKIKYSEGRHYFYLPEWTDHRGFWLSTRKYKDEAEMKAIEKPGIFGHQGITFTHKKTGEIWTRALLDFTYWNVQSERTEVDHVMVADEAISEMLLDYMSRAATVEREERVRLDELMKETGRTLDWVVEKIGPWVPIEEIPAVTLT